MNLLAVETGNIARVNVAVQHMNQLLVFEPLEKCFQNSPAHQSNDAVASAMIVYGTGLSGGEANQYHVDTFIAVQHDPRVRVVRE